jgi:hypothetical protein
MMGGEQLHVYRVSFKKPIDGKTDYFFGSLAAIYTSFSPQEVGCKVTRLWNVKVAAGNPYIGRRCTVSKERIARK